MKKYKINYKSIIFEWVNAYEQYGIDGLKHKTTKQKYTGEFKLHVIQYRQNNRLSYRETASRFKISKGGTIANWERSYKEKGMSSLNRGIGRPTEMSKKKLVRDTKI